MPLISSEMLLPRLQFLLSPNLVIADKPGAWRLEQMKGLRVLKLTLDSDSDLVGWRNMPELSWLELAMYESASFNYKWNLEDISMLRHLCVLSLDGSKSRFVFNDQMMGDSCTLCLRLSEFAIFAHSICREAARDQWFG